jgi:AAA domain
MIALDFINKLKVLPACLRVEPQKGGGWLIQCPGCSSYHGDSLFALNQLGEELLVRCYTGCQEEHLLESLHVAGGEAPLIGAYQWLEREVSRGHELAYLRGVLGRLLPLPPEFRPPERPRARTHAEFMALVPPPQESICGEWFPTSALVMVSGDSGAGKTWFCLDLALSVSTGVNFMGRWSVPKARKVLLVSGEDRLQDLQKRIPALLQAKSKTAGHKLEPMLTYLVARDRALLPNGLPNLGTPEGRAMVEDSLEGVSLVILDNYSVLFNGVEENDAKEFAPIQDWLFSLSARDIAVLLVTHTGKNGDHRGSSKKIDGLNTSIILNHPTHWKARDGASFELKFKKSRDAHGEEVDSFAAKLGEDEDGDICWLFDEAPPETQTRTKPSPKTAAILELHSQGKTAKEICAVGFAKTQVYSVLSALKNSTQKVEGVNSGIPFRSSQFRYRNGIPEFPEIPPNPKGPV